MLVEFVAGRAAEEIVFNTVTTGAANDIEKATRVARAMVTQYGMSEKFGLAQLESPASQYLDDGRIVMNCSEATAAEVDHEVIRILKDSYEQAKKLLTEHREAMNRIAEFLIEEETITGKQFMDLFYEVEGIDPSEAKKEARIQENVIPQETKADEAAAPKAEAADPAVEEPAAPKAEAADPAVEEPAAPEAEAADTAAQEPASPEAECKNHAEE